MNKLQSLFLHLDTSNCSDEDMALIAEAIEDYNRKSQEVDALKSAFGYLDRRLASVEKD